MASNTTAYDGPFPKRPTLEPASPYVTVELTDIGTVNIDHDMPNVDCDEYGFDLTDFGDPEEFSNLLRARDLEPGSNDKAHFDVVSKDPDEPDQRVAFVWSNPQVALITGNEPLSGVYNSAGMRPDKPGYASYMGVSGLPIAVNELVGAIRERSTHVKGSSPTREFI